MRGTPARGATGNAGAEKRPYPPLPRRLCRVRVLLASTDHGVEYATLALAGVTAAAVIVAALQAWFLRRSVSVSEGGLDALRTSVKATERAARAAEDEA